MPCAVEVLYARRIPWRIPVSRMSSHSCRGRASTRARMHGKKYELTLYCVSESHLSAANTI